MTCKRCARAQRDGFEQVKCKGIDYVDECPTGKVPRLSPENKRFWWLFQRTLPGLIDGYGGFNYGAIDFIFDLYDPPRGQRPLFHDKCLVVIRAIQERRRQKRDNA